MIQGSAPPKIQFGTLSITLPTPAKGGRSTEEQRDETKEFLNINGNIAEGKTKYRFHGEYQFRMADTSMASNIMNMINRNNRICVFYPYSDIDIKFQCKIKARIFNIKGYSAVKGLALSLKQIGTNSRLATVDSLYHCSLTVW